MVLLTSGVVALLTAAGLWLAGPRLRHWLLPPQRQRLVSWRGPEVLFALLVFLALPGVVYGSLEPLARWLQPDAVRQLSAALLALPLEVAAILGFLYTASGTRPYQLGLTRSRAGRCALLGLLGCVLLTPLVYCLLYVLTLLPGTSEEHPLTRIGRSHPSVGEVILVLLSALIVAPVREELVFRGVLQSWVVKNSWAATLVLAGAALFSLLAFWFRGEHVLGVEVAAYQKAAGTEKTWEGVLERDGDAYRLHTDSPEPADHAISPHTPPTDLAHHVGHRVALTGKEADQGAIWARRLSVRDLNPLDRAAPLVFVLVLLLGYRVVPWLVRRWIPRLEAAQAVYATAFLFGAVHWFAWPTPIPLFVLGLGLGFLAYRTQSLVASTTLHALFNGVGCLLLFFPQTELPPGPPKGNEVTSALRSPAVVSTLTTPAGLAGR